MNCPNATFRQRQPRNRPQGSETHKFYCSFLIRALHRVSLMRPDDVYMSSSFLICLESVSVTHPQGSRINASDLANDTGNIILTPAITSRSKRNSEIEKSRNVANHRGLQQKL
jgi:hypothetical protein